MSLFGPSSYLKKLMAEYMEWIKSSKQFLISVHGNFEPYRSDMAFKAGQRAALTGDSYTPTELLRLASLLFMGIRGIMATESVLRPANAYLAANLNGQQNEVSETREFMRMSGAMHWKELDGEIKMLAEVTVGLMPLIGEGPAVYESWRNNEKKGQ
jgi:hypothetical protein